MCLIEWELSQGLIHAAMDLDISAKEWLIVVLQLE